MAIININALCDDHSGRAEQWGSVSSKKDKKDKERTTSTSFGGVGGHQVPSRDGAASPGRGGFRGGRGGGFVGARGGRGGARGGGGGSGFSAGAPASGAWGKTPLSAGAKDDSAPTPTAETAEANGGANGWAAAAAVPTGPEPRESDVAPAEPVKSVGSQPAAATPVQHKSEVPAKAPSKAPQAPAKLSWAQIAK